MLPSEGVRRCPVTVCARGLMAPSDGVRRCPRFTAMVAETWVGVSDWLGSRLKLSARRSSRGFRAGAGQGIVLLGLGIRSSGSEGSKDLVELQSEREERERSVTEGDGSRQGSADS